LFNGCESSCSQVLSQLIVANLGEVHSSVLRLLSPLLSSLDGLKHLLVKCILSLGRLSLIQILAVLSTRLVGLIRDDTLLFQLIDLPLLLNILTEIFKLHLRFLLIRARFTQQTLSNRHLVIFRFVQRIARNLSLSKRCSCQSIHQRKLVFNRGWVLFQK